MTSPFLPWPLLANGAWFLASLPEAFAFRRSARSVEAAQWAVLRRIVVANAGTAFGRRHRFDAIDSVADYQQRVPLATPDVFAEDVARAAIGEPAVLTAEPIPHFVPTSGTTGSPKLIPFTRSFQRDLQRAIAPWMADLFLHDPALLRGSAYWSISPALQQSHRTAGGIPIGFAADEEYLGGLRRRLVRAIQSVPPEVAAIPDIDAFRYATLYFLVADRRLSLLSVWNPTFLTLLLAPLRRFGPSLARDVESGAISHPLGVAGPAAARLREAARSVRGRRRAATIVRALERESDTEMLASLWPHLRLISCWMDARAAEPARELAALFPRVRLQGKGLLSTEGFVSFPLGKDGGAALAIRSHVFEFREVDSGRVAMAHQLEHGARYSVILTTSGGLYRHPTGDLVEVTGFLHECPRLRFLGRESHVDYFGEKLSEAFAGEALAHTVAPFRFAMLAREGAAPAYTLYVESDRDDASLAAAARALDLALQASIHYRYCRALGQLEAVTLFRIERNGQAAYLARSAAAGQRVGDVKPVAIHPGGGWSAGFEGRWVDVDRLDYSASEHRP
jgi:hypothetical protein